MDAQTGKQAADVLVVGGGPAGLEAAGRLAQAGFHVLLLEKDSQAGGKLNQWDKLFPDFQDAKEVAEKLLQKIPQELVTLQCGTDIRQIRREGEQWIAETEDGRRFQAPAMLLATGFEPFNAVRKEEYGYRIYPNVITSVELEQMIGEGRIHTSEGKTPQSIAYIQCVGSRDEKVGNHYCSVNCCICAVKQSIEAKQLLPDVRQYCFYMDLRMTGQHFEERYRESQEKYHVNFIRGRVSESTLTKEGRIQIKAEDTLLSRPVKMEADLLVLMVGMETSPSTRKFARELGISDPYGFYLSADHESADNATAHPGLFVAGSGKRPLSVPKTLKDADAAAWEIAAYLNKRIKK